MRSKDVLKYMLGLTRRRMKAVEVAAGFFAISTFALVYILSEAILDHLFILEAKTRLVLLTIFEVLALLSLVRFLIIPLLRRINDLYIAKKIEDFFPHFKNTLISFLELRRRRDAPEEIKDILRERAAKEISGLQVEQVVSVRKFIIAGIMLLGVIVVFFSYALLSQKSLYVSLARFIHPRAPIAPPTYTRILEVKPGNITVLKGSDVEITARLQGRIPQSAYVYWSEEGGTSYRSLSLFQAGEGHWAGKLSFLEKSLDYYVAAGDARSEHFRITAVLPPTIKTIRGLYEFPPYTGLAPREVEGGSIDALQGTKVLITATSNKALRQAFLNMDGKARLLKKTDPQTVVALITVEKNTGYTLRFVDKHGFTNHPPTLFPITCRPDHPPRVEIERPGKDLELPLETEVPLELKAEDDFGLSQLELKVQLPDGESVTIAPEQPQGERQFIAKGSLKLSEFDLKPGDRLTYYAHTADNREPTHNFGRSPVYTLTISGAMVVSEAETEPAEETPSSRPAREEVARLAGPIEEEGERVEITAMRLAEEEVPAQAQKLEELIAQDTELLERMRSLLEKEAETYEAGKSTPVSPEITTPPQDELRVSAATGEQAEQAASKAASGKEPGEGKETAKPMTEGKKGEATYQGKPSPEVGGEGEKKAGPERAGKPEGREARLKEASRGEGSGEAKDGKEVGRRPSDGEGTTQAAGQKGTPSKELAGKGPGKGAQGREASKAGPTPGTGEQGGESSKPGRATGIGEQGKGFSGVVAKGDQAGAKDRRRRGAAMAQGGQTSVQATVKGPPGPGVPQISGSGTAEVGGGGGGVDTEVRQRPLIPGKRIAPPTDLEDLIIVNTVMEELKSRIETAEVDEEFLRELGWSHSRLISFVRKYDDALKDIRPWLEEKRKALLQGRLFEISEEALEEGEVLLGETGELSVIEARAEETEKDRLRRLFEEHKEEMAPEYRELVEEYYKALLESDH